MNAQSPQAPQSDTAKLKALFRTLDRVDNTNYAAILSELYSEFEKLKIDETSFNQTIFPSLKRKIYENEHSKILQTILKDENCLREFIQILPSTIDPDNYVENTVAVEVPINKIRGQGGRIDIQIENANSPEKRVIIIESKITRAQYQKNQLQKYYADRKSSGYTVDAVIYLVPNEIMRPPGLQNFPDELRKQLVILPIESNNKANKCTLYSFLEKCKSIIESTDNEILHSTIVQYEHLIRNLIKERTMEETLMNRLYSHANNSEWTMENIEKLQEYLAILSNEESFAKSRFDSIKNQERWEREGWEVKENDWRISQTLKFKSDFDNRNQKIQIEIGIAMNTDCSVYLYIEKHGNLSVQNFRKFVKKHCKTLIAESGLKFQPEDQYFWEFMELDTNDTIQNSNRQIQDFFDRVLVPNINKLKSLDIFVE